MSARYVNNKMQICFKKQIQYEEQALTVGKFVIFSAFGSTAMF